MKRGLFLILVLALVSFAFADVKVAQVEQRFENFSTYVEDAVVIKFERSTYEGFRPAEFLRGRFGIAEFDDIAEKYRAQRVTARFPRAPIRYYQGREINLRSWFKIQFTDAVDLDAVLADFQAEGGVISAQKIGVNAVYATPNDGSYIDQWHLNQSNDHDIDAPEAWDVETGNDDVIVAILDTGVRYYHKDLGGGNASPSNTDATDGNIWINTAEKNGVDGVDDDGNGYVDDWVGWDFVTGVTGWSGEDASTPDNDPRDFNGHGTHCSGIVAAINNNGYAVASPAGGWGSGSLTAGANGVKIMPMRIGYSGRYFIWEAGFVQMDFAADAFYYAANNGAKIASCSWGSSNSGGLGDAIDYFLASGGLVFKAAGNDDANASDYMIDRSDVITVASTDQNDIKSDFSSYGPNVDISAPGTDILSTYHDHSDPNNDYIASLSGTSMATPLTAGVAALIWSQNPGWSAAQVEQHLYDTSDDIYGLSGNSSYQGDLGAGRVNAYNAVAGGGGPLPPTAAFSASPTSGCAPLTVTFTDESTGDNITSWSWDFGDGNSSTQQNPSYSYANAGSYTVSLTVTGDGGSDTETKTDYIIVTTTPVAAFSGTPTSGNAPLEVSFTDQSTGGPTSWSWDFGDGNSSTAQNPTHTYSATGTYSVVLTASNTCGSDSETKVDYITVSEAPCDPPVAAFTGTPTSGAYPLNVNFTDQSTNTPTSWSWDFGDGGSSTAQNPSHTYDAAGTYTVTLTATNSCGSDGETKVDYITVTEPSQNDEVHVAAIEVTKETFWRWSRGVARVKVVDQNGVAVSSATVTGDWSGSASGSASFSTGSDGWGETSTGYSRNANDFEFCVTNISKSGYTYNSSANVATCGNSNGSTSTILTSISPEEMRQIEKDTGDKMAFASPNPFNPSTKINFLLPEASNVRLDIYNILGKRIATLYDEPLSAGAHTALWNSKDEFGNDVSSGTYFYVLNIENGMTIQGKLLYIK